MYPVQWGPKATLKKKFVSCPPGGHDRGHDRGQSGGRTIFLFLIYSFSLYRNDVENAENVGGGKKKKKKKKKKRSIHWQL